MANIMNNVATQNNVNSVILAAREVGRKEEEFSKRCAERRAESESNLGYVRHIERGKAIRIGRFKHAYVADLMIRNFNEDGTISAATLGSIVENINAAETEEQLRSALDALNESIVDGASYGFCVKGEEAGVGTAAQCLASDLCAIHADGAWTSTLIKVEYNIYAVFNPNASLFYASTGNSVEKTRQSLIERLCSAIMRRPIVVLGKDDKVSKTYVFWCASASMQKQGLGWWCESTTYARILPYLRMGRLNPEANGVQWNKEQAVYFTPSAPMEINPGEYVRIDEVLCMQDIEQSLTLHDAIVVNDAAQAVHHKEYKITVKRGDGFMAFLDERIDSAQMRGIGLKAFGVQCAKIAAGLKPKALKDIDGNPVKLKDFRALMTKSCWKIKGLSWAEYKAAAKKLCELYPLADALRVVRYADSAEEKQRQTSSQLVQQWWAASDEQLTQLLKRTGYKLRESMQLPVAVNKIADCAHRDTQTAFQRLIETCPGVLTSEPGRQWLEEKFDKTYADAASGSINICGTYPYITEDPVAILQVLLEHKNPNSKNLGMLHDGEASIPETGDGRRFAFVRFPANHKTARILTNRAIKAFDGCGNVAILPFYGDLMVVSDGDVDGDEAICIFDKIVMDLVEGEGKQPVVYFDHKSADKTVSVGMALANAIKFNLVGKFSVQASRCAARHALDDMAVCDVSTILSLDAVKTGYFPAAFVNRMKEIQKANQDHAQFWREVYDRHSYELPYWDRARDTKAVPGNDTMSRLDEIIGAQNFELADWGVSFDVNDLLDPIGVKAIPKSKLDARIKELLGLYSYQARVEELEDSEGKYSAKDLMVWAWKNMAAIKSRVGKDHTLGLGNALDDEATTMWLIREAILGMDEPTKSREGLTDLEKQKATVNWFIMDAFEAFVRNGKKVGNGIGANAVSEYHAAHLKASYMMFVLRVFAADILDNVEENLGVPFAERWQRDCTAEDHEVEDVDMFIGDIDIDE